MKKLSWKPKLRGNIYCSPACGGHCTKATFEKAKEDAQRLAIRLGKDWKPVIWENLGWHYKVIDKTGHIHIYVHENRYSACVGLYQNWFKSNSPEKAVLGAIRNLKQILESYKPLCKAAGIELIIK